MHEALGRFLLSIKALCSNCKHFTQVNLTWIIEDMVMIHVISDLRQGI